MDPVHPEPEVISEAALVLREGGLVAFPTETVYGLGANALNPDAVARIYAAKGRPAWNPVISHVASVADARALTSRWSDRAATLAAACWPGPLTLVLPRALHVPDIATAGRDGVAVRIPSHPVALALIRAAGFPIAAPSANRFTQVSPTTAQHVLASLGDRVDLVLDGGRCDVGIESTVCDLCGPEPTLLRPGMITRETLEQLLGCPVLSAPRATAAVVHDDASTVPQRSPGTADRHYAPRADVWLVNMAQRTEVASALQSRRDAGSTTMVTALLLNPRDWLALGIDTVVPMPPEPAEYAYALYAALHAADDAGTTLLLIERPPETGPWSALVDRLTRAAR